MGSGSHSSKRKKKRSQKSTKKRSISNRQKSKKLKIKRRHDSASSSDEDTASRSTPSCSSYSSEDDNRSKKRAKPRDRRVRKSRKKRVKKDSSINGSSDDSLHVKKRKRSKRDRDSESRKKRRRKMRRKEPSVSSLSSQSRSCPTCEPSVDSEREFGRIEHNLESNEREMGWERSVSKSRHSSRSCSPCTFNREIHSYHGEERPLDECRPNRLKSVIVAIIEREELEVKEPIRECHEDEIVYEHDDYPSRSNDSNDGVGRRESLYSDHDSYRETRPLEGQAVTSAIRNSESLATERIDGERYGGTIVCFVGDGNGDGNGGQSKVNGNDIATASSAGSNRDNLEAILRQKALENMLKRQGKLPKSNHADRGEDCDIEVKESSSLQKEPVECRPDEDARVKSVQKLKWNDDVKHTTNATGAVKGNDCVCPPSSKSETCHPLQKDNAFDDRAISRPKLGLSTSSRRPIGSSNTWKRELTSKESLQSKVSVTKETVVKDSAKGSEYISSDAKVVTEKEGIVASTEPSPSGGNNTKNETNEDDDPDFQQKTMTVMRGGELVQVSYKVKIPKKAPALARRQLKR